MVVLSDKRRLSRENDTKCWERGETVNLYSEDLLKYWIRLKSEMAWKQKGKAKSERPNENRIEKNEKQH